MPRILTPDRVTTCEKPEVRSMARVSPTSRSPMTSLHISRLHPCGIRRVGSTKSAHRSQSGEFRGELWGDT
jgi:hypothetical protein